MTRRRKVLLSVSNEKDLDDNEDIVCNMDEGIESVPNGTNQQQGTLAGNGSDSDVPNGLGRIGTDNTSNEGNVLVEDQEVWYLMGRQLTIKILAVTTT